RSAREDGRGEPHRRQPDAPKLVWNPHPWICRDSPVSCQPRKRKLGEANMPPYFVVELEITNQEAMKPYRAAVPATMAQYGGRFLTRGGSTELIEGGPEPKRVVIVEFADKAAFRRWYDSPEYQKILPGRLDNSTGRAFVVEGVS